MTTTTGPDLWATRLSDQQRETLRSLTGEAEHLEGVVRAFAIRAFDALQPFIEARSLPEVSEEDTFYEWSGAMPLIDVLERISDHAHAAALLGTTGAGCDWFDEKAFYEKERAVAEEHMARKEERSASR